MLKQLELERTKIDEHIDSEGPDTRSPLKKKIDNIMNILSRLEFF